METYLTKNWTHAANMSDRLPRWMGVASVTTPGTCSSIASFRERSPPMEWPMGITRRNPASTSTENSSFTQRHQSREPVRIISSGVVPWPGSKMALTVYPRSLR
ncbi:hypothetical protein D3C76_1440590 [compost metagenome]